MGKLELFGQRQDNSTPREFYFPSSFSCGTFNLNLRPIALRFSPFHPDLSSRLGLQLPSPIMAGAKPKFRHLSRDSAHRQALLRNLVTSLFTHETISTTWPKAKEAQRMAEKLITLAKKNTPGGRIKAQAHFYVRFLSYDTSTAFLTF